MSFTDDVRPGTRGFVIAHRWLTGVWVTLGLAAIALTIVSTVAGPGFDEQLFDKGGFVETWSWAYLAWTPAIVADLIVVRAKKNADARWALAESRTAVLAAEVAAALEPAAR